ncbi:hypothetical protein HPP92_024987 [Vanilla planifolia]|uniref:Protein kinase domain-containing protein n=1 Tax=Vanilla planifolia TaxID=51239 RepID=A0A835U9Z7_VANPL|nr:hypothetical protein HPP92_024987 [Vanilla planifolia]
MAVPQERLIWNYLVICCSCLLKLRCHIAKESTVELARHRARFQFPAYASSLLPSLQGWIGQAESEVKSKGLAFLVFYMNNYHVYEAIGRGKHSSVYKGRLKKTIEYYAIKSVDKSQRSKVLHEVKMLHGLNHPNILKFYSWYESSAHLWLILEYCVGRDLLSLLKEDGQLPEDSIHDLAHDIVSALQFLHSKGIIYGDLKPSNILLDEDGHIKLCDFGLAQRISEIEETSVNMLPQSKRGTPCYMAPELFKDGVNSYASDLWALGCVLFECYAGKPPFVGNEFTKLARSILVDSTPNLPNNPSDCFVDLVNGLLVKDPTERLSWRELCGHKFWQTKFSYVPLPPHPSFNSMLQQSAKSCLIESNEEKPSKLRTPIKGRENCASGEKSSTRKKVMETHIKNSNIVRKAHTKATETAIEAKRKAVEIAVKGANLLRLSRVAKLNLQRENEKGNYRRHLPSEVEVKIENNDMELDFSETPEDDVVDETDASENPASSPCEGSNIQNENHKLDGMETDINQDDTISNEVSIMSEALKKLDHDTFSRRVEIGSSPPSTCLQRTGYRTKATSGTATELESPMVCDEILKVLWHRTDATVKPVMPSRKVSRVSDSVPPLPFETVPACEYAKLLPEQLSALNSELIRGLSGSLQNAEKIIRYLEILSINSDAANVLCNGPVMLSLVKMLRHPKTSSLRVQIASLIGLLIRHSTYIENDLASSGIMDGLVNGLRDKLDKVRRFSMAALGELLFYISTLSDSSGKDRNDNESQPKDKRCSSGWQVPNPVIGLVSSILRKGEDDIAQLYALRTIENICSQGEEWASRFANQDVIGNLCYIYKATSKQESTRLIAGSCLVRIAYFHVPIIQLIFEKLSIKDIASSLIKSSQCTTREKQICINLLNLAILSNQLSSVIARNLFSMLNDLVSGLIVLIEQGNEILRGKTLVLLGLICKKSRRWLPQFLCNAKLLSAIDRLTKEKDDFLQPCLNAFVQLVSSTVPEMLDAVSEDIQQIMGGKRHGFVPTVTARTNSKSTSDLFPVILHLLGSSSFKHRIVNYQVLVQLANLLKLLEASFQGRDDFQMTLLQILEAVTEESSVILDDPKIFSSRVLPGLAVLYKDNKDAGARFLCLKILFDIVVVMLSDMPDAMKSQDGQVLKDLKVVTDNYFLPLYPNFIKDEDPIPMYAQKLLVMLIEYKYIKILDILHVETVSECFEFLLNDLSHANVNNVKLCLALVSAPEMDSRLLSDLGVVRKIGNLLEYVNSKVMEDFLEPTLGLCKSFLLRSIGTRKGSNMCKQPALLCNAAPDTSLDSEQQYFINDISDFSSHISVFLELIGNPDLLISDLASECIILLLKVAPREATMGLLTNISKIIALLECLNDANSVLKLLRLLYAIAFACKQYFSQALILSISMADVMRLEVFLSDLKNSNFPGVSDAAWSLGMELQRLPRCV